jgi:hypothetical protein
MRLAGIIAQRIDRMGLDMVFLDTAYGYGCRDRLVEMGYGAKTLDIHFGSEPLMPELYRNKRAQMYGFMKDWFEEGGCSIPDSDIFVRDLLMIPGFSLTSSRGLLTLPPKEQIRKDNNGISPDLADALCFLENTLITTPYGKTLIQQLKEGDKVCTPFGNRRIIKTHVSRTNKLTRVKFSNGKILVGTPNHKVFSFLGGLCPLNALSLTNVIETDSALRRRLWRFHAWLYMTEKNIGFKVRAGIIRQEQKITRKDFCIGEYMRTNTEQYQKEKLFIIKTIIGKTIELGIWSWKTCQSMLQIICKNVLKTKNIAKKINMFWKKFVLLLRYGMGQKKEKNGTVCTVNKHGKTENQFVKCASYAEKNTKRIFIQEVDFVPAHVNKKKDIKGTKPQKKNVLNVVKNLFLTSTGLKPVVPESVLTYDVEETNVYNLTLEQDNVYYANGILVENCLTFAFPIRARMSQSNIRIQDPDKVRVHSPFKSRRLSQTFVKRVQYTQEKQSELYIKQ